MAVGCRPAVERALQPDSWGGVSWMRPSCKLADSCRGVAFLRRRRRGRARGGWQRPVLGARFRPGRLLCSAVACCDRDGVLRSRWRARRVTSRLNVADEAPKASQGIPAKLTLNLLAPHQSIFKAQEVDQVCSS